MKTAKNQRGRQLNGTSSGYANLSSPNVPTEIQTRSQKQNDANIYWHRFGSDNLFPRALAALSRASSTHRSVLKNKTTYCIGKRFFLAKENAQFQAFIDKCNSRNETLRAMTKKPMYDFLMSGNGYVEIVTDSKRSFISFFHKDTTVSRAGKDAAEGNILLHPNWYEANNTRKEITKIPLYPKFAMVNGFMRSMLHLKQYEPEFAVYGIPDYIAGMNAATVAYKTTKWNLSRLDNEMLSSGVLTVDGNFSPEDAKKLKDELVKAYTGEGKQGKIFFVVKSLGGDGTKFLPFNSTKEGDWVSLHKQSDSQIITAHNWFPSLSGVQREGSQIGNNDQIRTEFEIARATVISEVQEVFLELFKMVLATEMGWEDELLIDNAPPVSIADKIKPELILKRNEMRAVYGYEPDEDVAVTLLTGIQATTMAETVQKAGAGQMPIEAAKIIIQKLGATEDESTRMLASIVDGSFKNTAVPAAAQPVVTTSE